jgi:predicted dehydrogenase
MEPVRFGLVGYGFGGRWFHAPLLAAAPECDFLGVVTTSAERRTLVEREHPTAALFGSLEELAAAGAEAVAISTPATTHTELTDRALDLGLAVVSDKPFALDAAAARGSVELAERLGLSLAPYQNRRWDSDFLTVRALVDRDALGTVTRFESRFERFDPEPGPPSAGGGTLLDFGSHLVDQALVLLGPVASVYAEWRLGGGHGGSRGLDDDVFVALTHENGTHSHLWGSWSQAAPGSRFRVSGTEAAYEVGGPMDGQEAALLAGRTPATEGERWGVEPRERWGRLVRGGEGEPVPTDRGRWDIFYPAFARAVRGEGAVPVEPRDAVVTATVLDAARRSATDGVVVRLT